MIDHNLDTGIIQESDMLARMRVESISAVHTGYLKAIDSDDRIEIDRNRRTLRAVNYFFTAREESRYYEWLVHEISVYYDKKEFGPAAYFCAQGLDLGIFSDLEIDSIYSNSKAAGYFPLVDELNRRYERFLEETIPVPWSTVSSGTVTVWVDHGLVFKSGFGTPELVIGSGFFIDPNGYILTNYHVIESEVEPDFNGYSKLFIRLPSGQKSKIPARVVGWDKAVDIALIKAEINPDYFLPLYNLPIPDVGTKILAIGSPGGLENTLTSGIVSTQGRRFLEIGDVIQVDVPINHGNSGGPLLDEKGNIVGIVFAGVEQFEGINFAIPLEWILPLLPDLYAGGAVKHAWIGTALAETPRGLEVIYIAPKSPAKAIGFEKGDILSSVDGNSVSSISDAQRILNNIPPATLVKISINRNHVSRDFLVCTSQRPNLPILEGISGKTLDTIVPVMLGFELADVETSFFEPAASVVTRILPGSIADEAGFSVNDPVSISRVEMDNDNEQLIVQLSVKKKKSSYWESYLQISAYLRVDFFL